MLRYHAREAPWRLYAHLLQTATFRLVGNSHIDAAWLWPWTETVEVVKRTFSTAAQLMREYPSTPTPSRLRSTSRGWPINIPPKRQIQHRVDERSLGDRGRHVGRAGPQYARR